MGQIGAETYLGTIRVPTDLQYCAKEMQTKFAEICEITRISAIKLRTFVSDEQMPNNPGDKARDTGGTSQLFSPAQSKQKAFTPSEPGFQKREKNLSNLRWWELAKRSTECGSQMLSTWWKNSKETPQSSKSTILLMVSACSLRDLGIQSTCKSMPLGKTS